MEKVLVVSDSPRLQVELARALIHHGVGAVPCFGPHEPSYVCVAGLGGRCPLADDVRAVVLDMDLAGNDVPGGMPSSELLDYYLGLGLPVVALGSADGRPAPQGAAAALPRRIGTRIIADAVARTVHGVGSGS